MVGYLDCYLRVSSRVQKKEGHSLESQRMWGKSVSKKLGLTYREHDEGVKTSTNYQSLGRVKRDVLEEIKDKIELGEIKNLWVMEQQRLFRDEFEPIHMKKYYFDPYNIQFFTGENTQGIQFGKDQSNIMYLLNSWLSSEESKTIRRRSIRGKRHLLDNYSQTKSIFLGGTSTFGYKNVDKEWVIHKEESKWIKWMFKSYSNGLESIEIKKELDRNNVKPRRSILWNLGTIQKMLKNESYTGLKRWRDKDIEKVWEYKIPQIISVSLFQKVQKKLEENKRTQNNNKKTDFLLDGLLFCNCGLGMGSESKTRSYGKQEVYYCYSRNRKWRGEEVNDCNNQKSLERKLTEEEVMKLVEEVVHNSTYLKEQFKLDILSNKELDGSSIKIEKKRLENKVKKLQGSIEHTISNISLIEFEIIQGKKDKKVGENILKLLVDERKQLTKDYQDTFSRIEELDKNKDWVDWLEKYGDDLRVKTSTHSKRREFIEGLVNKVVVDVEHSKDRDGNKIQVGQTLTIHFKVKIVKDKIEYYDKNNKSLGYEIVKGNYTKNSNVMSLIKGRGQPKKKAKIMKSKVKTVPTPSITVE